MISERARVPGGEVAYVDTGGDRPPIVFVHGNSASRAVWRLQLAGALRQRWRLVALDLPGCGESARREAYDIPTLAETLVHFADAARCADAVFVGHSLGGHLLLEAAARLNLMRGMVLLGSPPLRRPPSLDEAFLPSPVLSLAFKGPLSEEEIGVWTQIMARPHDGIAGDLAADVGRADPRLREGLARSLMTLDHEDEVAVARDLGCELAILHGAADGLVNGAYLRRLELPTLWRNAVQEIAGAGHYPQLTHAEIFDGLLDAFAGHVPAV